MMITPLFSLLLCLQSPNVTVGDVMPGDVIAIDTTISGTDAFFTATGSFLADHVANGRVDYAAIASDKGELQSLYQQIAGMDLSDADNNTKTAFYLNAYNIVVIWSVVEKYPISSPLDVDGFFDKRKHVIAGESMTLNALEEKKLRPDARVHFALVCAAKGCPKLQAVAYLPATVQKQLNEVTAKALNDPQFLRVDYTNKNVQVSQIFEWYVTDFTQTSGSVIAFINTYRSAKIPDNYKIGYYEYDWALNKK